MGGCQVGPVQQYAIERRWAVVGRSQTPHRVDLPRRTAIFACRLLPNIKNKCEILIQVSPFSIQINFYSYIMRYYDHADVLVFFTVQRKNKLPYFGPIRTHS